MSRFKRFAHSLMSGYVLLAVNVLYTFASARVAVHYLNDAEFGLWSVITTISTSLLLIDLGMSGSVARILIDHKDDKQSGIYGSVVQTGLLVLLVQGAAIALIGAVLSFWLPSLAKIPEGYTDMARALMAWQCGALALTFVGRIFSHVLQAHQRFDIQNYAQMAMLATGFVALWIGFKHGMGLYSQIIATIVGFVFNTGLMLVAALKLEVFPKAGQWGKPSRKIFKELFAYGNDLFLLSVGVQLLTASQATILSRTLGLEASAIWSNMTKTFMLGQQFVSKIFDFSGSALSEMAVRNERERMAKRFRDIVILTASVAVLAGAGLAACNDAFVDVWLKGRFSWSPWNNWLMAVLLVTNCISRCHVGLLGQTKDIGSMRYIYFLEGVCFVIAAYLVAPHYGFAGVIVSAIVSNIVWSGSQGIRRTAQRFGVSGGEVAFGWLAPSRNLFLLLWPAALGCWWLTRQLPDIASISINTAVVLLLGGLLLLRLGLTSELRADITRAISRARAQFGGSP